MDNGGSGGEHKLIKHPCPDRRHSQTGRGYFIYDSKEILIGIYEILIGLYEIPFGLYIILIGFIFILTELYKHPSDDGTECCSMRYTHRGLGLRRL